eukprot:5748024-Pyramimonas_sp.AAC.1
MGRGNRRQTSEINVDAGQVRDTCEVRRAWQGTPVIPVTLTMQHDRGAPAHGPRLSRNARLAYDLEEGGGPTRTHTHQALCSPPT